MKTVNRAVPCVRLDAAARRERFEQRVCAVLIGLAALTLADFFARGVDSLYGRLFVWLATR